jgi:hypothetical protein
LRGDLDLAAGTESTVLTPALAGFPPRQRPAEALDALAAQLRARGIGPLYGASCRLFGMLSLPGASVWTNGRLLWWRSADGEITWPAADAPGVARVHVELGQHFPAS